MRIRLQDSFIRKLNRQVAYIAWDKPSAARKFKNDLLIKLKGINDHPFKHRKSIYFDDKNIRDLIFKGYTI
ncbi:MAG: type II toxin-antitoxin system RelE/ParE family toxin, partial [Cytophagia bacterium]|nr:type II toxin-antitoxin system RelE/ParE family toxin [Cytophagia bacterium]